MDFGLFEAVQNERLKALLLVLKVSFRAALPKK